MKSRALLGITLGAVLLLAGCAANRRPAQGSTAAANNSSSLNDGYRELPGDKNIKNPEVAYNLALESQQKGDMEAAHHYIALAMKLQPDSKYSFVQGVFFLQEQKYPQAAAWLQRSLEQGPGTTENRMRILNALGASYMQMGNDQQALKYLREVVNTPGPITRYQAYYNMGIIYFRQKKYLDAEADFMKVLSENNSYYPAMNKLGLIWASRGDWNKASGYYKRALKLLESNYDAYQASGAEIYYNYAEALFHLKQYAECRKTLMKVLDIGPESKYGQKAKAMLAKLGGPPQ
ncbi:MAG: tetratricopeptide repeat protein [Acidobacteriota bacterium]|jgi:tetratricopeptide (TPR) repeat protein